MLENKKVEIDNFQDKEAAYTVITEAIRSGIASFMSSGILSCVSMIPAQAGIHGAIVSGLREWFQVSRASGIRRYALQWVPACAGIMVWLPDRTAG